MEIRIRLKKQAQKYLDKVPENVRNKLIKGIERIKSGDGDIKRIGDNYYRYKIHQYRILFSIESNGEIKIIVINEINSRTNIKY